MDIKKKFTLKSILKGSSNSGSNASVDHNSDRRSHSQSLIDSNELTVGIKKDEFINSYMKEKENRESFQISAINNPELESDILNSIDTKYFDDYNDNSIDFEQMVFNHLPQQLDVNYLIEEKQRLKQQLVVVSKKVSDLILKNQWAYTEELERVTQLQSSLSDAIKVCTSARMCLEVSKRDFTCVSLGIVASYRRREVLKGLLKSLQTIKTLQETDIRLRELLEDDEDYTAAIQLYLECRKVVSNLKHYSCISELSTKLQDTLEMTEEQIDVALSKMCTSFNRDVYLKLQFAYKLLGKTQTAMDQLLMHFASAIHNKAFSIVLGYVELFSTNDMCSNFHKRQYNELCKQLTCEGFLPCLTDLCKALWDIMLNYYRILSLHRELNDDDIQSNDTIIDETDKSAIDLSFNKRFVRHKLEHGLGRVWQDVQQKVRTLILNHDLSSYNFDEFIKILDIAETMVHIGEEFCGNKSEDLQDILHKQTINYFQNYHKSCIYELKIFLDNEMWSLCPVTHKFSYNQLQEFAFLKKSIPSVSALSPNSSPSKKQQLAHYFTKSFLDQTNTTLNTPFNESFYSDESKHENYTNDSNLEKQIVSHEIEKEDECKITEKMSNGLIESEPIVANTTLNVLRLIGKYMHMMTVLQPIAFDVLLCMFQLFDYYLYTVYKFFAKDMVILSDSSLSNEMKLTIKRISDNLIIEQNQEKGLEQTNQQINRYHSAVISSMVDMTSIEKLCGLPERIVAVESLIVLSKQIKNLQSNLEVLIPKEKKLFLEQYLNQVVSIASDLRNPAYMWVTVKCVQYEHFVSLMSQTKWDLREILSMHNEYVDLFLRELQTFSARYTQICKNQLQDIVIPKQVYVILWENVLRLSNRTFIEGFSQAKKCTNEGRALMQLDYQQFLTKVETLTWIRPNPERELVEDYIKAYYLTEPALIDWIKTRKDYNPKQLIALVNCITFDNKKVRNRIISGLDLKL